MTTEPEAGSWRPWTFSKAGLLSYFVLCVGLFIANEVTISLCRPNGCRVFGHSSDGSMPGLSRILYISVPMILGILLSLRWIWPHHDIIRLEPYFQMSTKYGAKASISLFLEYPNVLFLLLPLKALKNKHYIVALSSSILLLMNYVVVFAVPALFDSSAISKSIPGEAMQVEFNATAQPISTDSTFFAYEYAWRNGTLSPFMTADYALLPVKPLDKYVFVTNETWTVQTTLLEAELRCNDAQRVSLDHWGSSNSLPFLEIFQNGNTSVRLCDALALDRGADFNNTMCDSYMAFIAPWSSLYWQMDNSTKYPAMSYMFGWASGPSSPPILTGNYTSPAPVDNITAIFCTPEYYTQPVNATVSVPNGTVHYIERHGERRRIDPPQGFDGILDGNGQNFTGVHTFVTNPHELSQNRLFPVRFGYPPNTIAKVEDDLLERFGKAGTPVKPPMYARASASNVFMTRTESLAAFALYSQNNSTLGALLDTNELKGMMEKGLRTLFAFAIATASADINGTRTISLEVNVPGVLITVNKLASNAIRVGLLLSLLLAAFLDYLIQKRPCHLNGEPNTMAAALKMLSVSPALRAVMKHAEFYTQKELMSKLDKLDLYFRITVHENGGSMIQVFKGKGGSEVTDPNLEVLKDPGASCPVHRDTLLLSPAVTQTLNVVFFPILFVVLVATFAASRRQDGFPMPRDPNSVWSKALFKNLPVITGSVGEALLISLGTVLRMTSPYKTLIDENKKVADYNTLRIKSDRIPPQFQLTQPLYKNAPRQYKLVIVSVCILLANLLPVLTGGLFPHSFNVPTVPKSHEIRANIPPHPRQEIYFQLDRNITSHYSPSWTTGEYYIDPPFTIPPSGEATHSTRGFGLDISCTVVPDERVEFPCSNSTRYRKHISDCPPGARGFDNVIAIINPCGYVPTRPAYSGWSGSCYDWVSGNNTCPDRIYPVWAENKRYASTPNGAEDEYRFVVLNCSLTDRIVELRATVRDGQVLSVGNVVPVSDRNTTYSLARDFATLILQDVAASAKVVGPHPLGRINELMVQMNPAIVQGEDTHLPSGLLAQEAFAAVLKQLFPLLVRLYAVEMFEVQWVGSGRYRAYVDKVSFAITLGLLVFLFCVVVWLYMKKAGKVMGHLPHNLAAVYSHLYASNAMPHPNSPVGTAGKGSAEVEVAWVYKYGEYPMELGPERHYGVYKVADSGDLYPAAADQ